MTPHPADEPVEFIQYLLRGTRTYSMSERKVSILLARHLNLSQKATYHLLKRLVKDKMFYRTVHHKDYQSYPRIRFNYTKKGIIHAISD